MKYLLYTLEYPPQIGGVADYYYNLVFNWPKESKMLVYDISQKGTKTNFSFKYWPVLIYRLIKKIKKEEINYIIVGHVLPLGSITFLASFFAKFKYSVCFHGLDYSCAKKRNYKKILTFLIIKKAKKIICANSYVANEIAKDFPKLKNKIIISNPGARVYKSDDNLVYKLKKKYGLSDKKVIFSLGRLIERKGFDNMIKALAILKKENYNLFNKTIYLIAGLGPDLKRLKEISYSHKVSDNIIFLEKIESEEKFAFYSLCHIFAMPARQVLHDYEGFGIVYLEANLFKKPVIAGKSGGVPDAVVDNLNGLLINPNDTLLIKNAVEKLLTNETLAKKLGEKGYIRAKNDFNWHNLAKNLKEKL